MVTRSSRAATAAEAIATLRCPGLRKRFGTRLAVDGISFEIAPGETYGLLGPNGGKTTTISVICGILSGDEGEVVVAGERLDVASTHAKRPMYTPAPTT